MKKIDNSMDLFTFTEHNDELIKKKKNKIDDLDPHSEFLNIDPADIDINSERSKNFVDNLLKFAVRAANEYDKMIDKQLGEQNGNNITEIGRDEYNQPKSVQDINEPHGRRGINGEIINNDNRQPNRISGTGLNGKTISNSNGISNDLFDELGFKERIGNLLSRELTKRTLQKMANRIFEKAERNNRERNKQRNSSELANDNKTNSINQSSRSSENGQLLGSENEPSQRNERQGKNRRDRSDDGRGHSSSIVGVRRTSGEFEADEPNFNQSMVGGSIRRASANSTRTNQNDEPNNANNATTSYTAISETGQGDNAKLATNNEPNDELFSGIFNTTEQQINTSKNEPNSTKNTTNAEVYNEPSQEPNTNRADESRDKRISQEQSTNQNNSVGITNDYISSSDNEESKDANKNEPNSTKNTQDFITYSQEEFQIKYENLPNYKGSFDFELNKKERINANYEALELTQTILKDKNRTYPFPNEKEQEILAKFSGYGGLKELFIADRFEKDRKNLEALVGNKNYKNLMESSQTAFYTPDDMIKYMYEGLSHLGTDKKEKIYALEPSCGIGKFISLAPNNYEFEAVEKDTLTATIAKMLNPSVKIYNSGFEDVETYRSYDVVVGNPPFSGDIKIYDSRSVGSGMSIHNYFAVRSSELLKDGGVLSFVTSAYFLDSINNRHREILSNNGKFLLAFRLPSSAFGSSHTEVLTDIFYYTKLNKMELKTSKDKTNPFLNSLNFPRNYINKKLSINLNNYYDENPENMLGIASASENNPFGEPRLVLKEDDENRWQDKLSLAIAKIHQNLNSIFKLNEPFVQSLEEIPFVLMSKEKFEYVTNLGIGSIYEFGNKFYTKIDKTKCEELYFIDELPLDKEHLVAKVDIIETKDKNFTYKSHLNPNEFALCQKVVEFRDNLKDMLDSEKTLSNNDENTKIIDDKKAKLREMRDDILKTAKVKFLNSKQHKKRDNNGKVTMHTLSDIINLDGVNCFKIYATENLVEQKGDKTYELSDILKKRVLFAREITLAKNPTEVLAKSINDFGKIRTDYFTTYLPSMSEDEITQELVNQRLIFRKFDNSGYELASQFLSGNVKEKYKICQDMIEKNISFSGISLSPQELMRELENYFPKYIPYQDLNINFGANYISTEIYEKFIRDTFFNNPQNAVVEVSYFNGIYFIENFKILNESTDESGAVIKIQENANSSDLNDNALNIIVRNEKGEIYFDIRALIELVINNKSLEVKHYEKDENDPNKFHTIVETAPTRMAMDNAEIIRKLFDSFCFNNENIREQIAQSYNDKINVFANKTAPFGDYLTMPNLSDEIKLRPHQKDVVYKGILQNALMLDHQVGAGKTFASIVMAMEQKRMGVVNKPLILVPNHMSKQWANDFMKCYPSANILVGDSINSKKDRKEFLYKARYGEFDAIIMKHSTFENMNVMQSYQSEVLQEQIEILEKKLRDINGNDIQTKKDENKFVMQLNNQKNKLTRKLKKLAEGKKFDGEIAFEDLGIDALFVDEAQNFKNLFVNTSLQGIKGLPLTNSQKAMKMLCATRYCRQNNYKFYFMTGTPVSNSISEFFIMQTYLQPDLLEKIGLTYFDDWQKAFTQITLNEELDSSGVNYKIVSRLSKFINVPELMNIYKQNVDIITNEDIEKKIGRFVPRIKGGNPTNIIIPRTENIANFIGIENEQGEYNEGSIIWRMDNLKKDPQKNNMLACTTDARKAALDFRMIEPLALDEDNTKINAMIKKCLEHYGDENYPKNTQLIFCDMGVSKKNSQKIDINDNSVSQYDSFETLIKKLELERVENDNGEEVFAKLDKNGKIIKSYTYEELLEEQGDKFDIYADVLKKLVNSGIPQKEIAFIGDAKSDKGKQELFDKVNNGEIRFLIGSTSKMGAGTNVQKRIIAMHELDCPWRPCDLEQRLGRVVRQGNMWFENDESFEISSYRYATEQTYDARMFQVNEQKLRPLAQIKKGDFSDGVRVYDSVDGEIANIAEMKAFATGNMFVLEKHKISNLLDTENRLYDNFKRQIISNQNNLKRYKQDIKIYESELAFLRNVANLKISEFDNYEIKAFGIKTTRRANGKNDEEFFKKNKENINKTLNDFVRGNGEAQIEALELKGIKITLKFSFANNIDGENKTFIKGIMSDKDNNTFEPINLLFKKVGLFVDISYDGLIQRIENTINKASNFFNAKNHSVNELKSSIEMCERFLEKNSLESYERANILKIIEQDSKNINEIFRIRNELKKGKEGIIINDLSAPQIAHLAPKYPLVMNKNEKLDPSLVSDEILESLKKPAQNLEKNKNEIITKVINKDEPKEVENLKVQDDKPKSMRKEDVLTNSTKENDIEIKEFTSQMSVDERLKILEENQIKLENIQRSRKILK